LKNTKLGHKGALPGSSNLLLNWDPLISLEWLKIQTRNFARWLTVRVKPKKLLSYRRETALQGVL